MNTLANELKEKAKKIKQNYYFNLKQKMKEFCGQTEKIINGRNCKNCFSWK